ncbi:transcription factor FapR [Sporolactobacillus sp. Y61]|jgi:acyl-coenzyme A thioesterase PaaI-like protein|uniref:Transcription factor FapR n=1 Tax=Sporolactobacillus sp. Y61 TaxID=3160863 RepID=A0AAU8ICQ9_9BACL|nr:transcription factor FapR [Sporolactobacillus sp. THM19-2]RYL92920.1 transcription factor FapR [Sporolactobacillus sp. THM19-2]
MRKSKQDRQAALKQTIQDNPFITDDELAQHFSVSVQTIRLDRLELSIPELRERIKHVARKQFDEVKALHREEVIGEIIDLQLDQSAISILDINQNHVFSRTGIARGHHLFAQANSLAVAVINNDLALTSKASIHFIRPVKAGERVVAKARVVKKERIRTVVEVNSYAGQDHVFRGIFTMFRSHRSKGKEKR